MKSEKEALTILLVVLIMCVTVIKINVASAINATFEDSINTEKFNHLVVDKRTGRIYIGAVNRLYQLTENLKLEVSEKMGPKDDSPECPVSKNCPTVTKKPTDYVNKALLIDYVNNSLITCGSLFQGVCQLRSLDNISIAEEPVKEAVVANNATASTVTFIAPGPPNSATTSVIYVGATFTGNGPYRQEVPAMSSRSLDSNSLFQLASTTVTTGTRMFVNSLARESYPITYVYGFSSEGFSYFVSVQKQAVEESAPYISKLIRLCHNDQHYYSHTEVPLDCSDNNSSYNLVQAAYLGKPGSELAANLGISVTDDVLFGVFSKSHWENNLKPSTQSALCIYSLELIRNLFTENIKDCYLGKVDRGLDFINPSVKCQNTLIPINHNFCGTDVNTPLGGKKPIKASAVIVYPYETLTSVASVPTHDYTVVFMGTSNGDLKKVVIESATHAIEYGNLTINKESPVDSDLFFDRNQTFLYVMTERKVSKVQVQQCKKYNTCTECLGSKDPYCGWCSLENKCKLHSECSAVVHADPLYWLSYRSGKCTVISNVEPKQIQRTTARKLSLTIENLPSLLGQFLCVFTVFGKTMITNATRSSTGVSCPTPRTDELPAILPGEHHFVARLSVRIKVEPEFVETNFTFYDCNSYTSCTSCVSSPFPCDWCVEGHRCTHNTGEYCRKDYLITGISSTGSSIRSGPSFCPRINSTSKEILVPSGMFHNVTVQAINIQPFQTRFQCQFNMEGRIKHANAQLSGETITCESYQFLYASFSPNSTATFAVLWSGNKPLDNPDFIHLTIYKCTAMASNCGLCLELDPKFNCGWCESMCYVKSQCTPRTWLNRSATCPDPQITQFYPMTGPWEGGTELTIEGINLGKNFADIKNGVKVAGIPCEPIEELYERTSKIVCRTDTIGNNDPLSGRVVVKVNDYEGKSAFKYTYMDPKIRDISPTKGPKSGGTKVMISGEYMNAGSNITASIGGHPCRIFSKFTTEVVCITSWSFSSQNGSVVMQFDRGRRFFTSKLFYYSEDPTIIRAFSSASTNRDGPKGIPSGGILIFVEGTNFDSIQEPKMAVTRHGKSYESPCEVLSPTEMRCRAPILAGAIISPLEYPVDLDYGFIMDNVTLLRNLTSTKFKPYVLYPDPIYKPFSEKDQIKYSKSDHLNINGEYLDGSCKESDVVVQIGTGICNISSLTSKLLTCRLPANQPAALDEKNIPLVVVMVGSNLNYTIGYLSYATPTIFEGGLPRPIIIGITVGGGILLIIVVIILIAYRRKSTESSRLLKNMQEQMDVLELRVASECKEAFAELQTEMTDFTNDLSASGIPFLDYRSYSMKVLFPNVEDHPVLRETLDVDPIKKTHIEKGLRLFGHLIMNKTFLLLFIRTLESNRYFSMRDRVNVASLIMVTLQGKMEYCTDILKTLLAELIERCLEGRSHPKLLLRRTESVAEKMLSAWFTFLLYKFLKECAGEPLFLLYRAIKQQVDKGPVDAITSEARYSLSEEKLIRQQIEYKSMTVYVSGLEPQTENIEIPVKVICCDIISQVKDKALDAIYKNTPYSQRPSKDDLDLEWRTGNTGRLILQDEDMTTKPEGEYKRVNTLAHYKVPDLASLTLVPRQSSIYNMSLISDKSEKSHKFTPRGNQPMAVWAIQENFSFKTSSSPPLSRATSPNNHELDTGFKLWHLVKQHDADTSKEGERSNKMVSEIYLTRLLATKGTLQKFVDDLFETIFSTAHRGSALPLAIKYMFDFLDDQALQHVISDPEVVHTWKSNSLPLRFWVNLIKNPNFVFDINKSNIVDSCLSVVAQTFMDSCSTSDHRLGKDSPSSKLLYAKDIPVYKEWVERYYQDIKLMPAISDQDMNAMLAEESRLHLNEFNVNSAVFELYKYAIKHNDQLIQSLEEDEFSKKNRLAYKLEQIHHIMSGESEA